MMSCTSYERTTVYVNSSRNHALSHTLASRRFAASTAAACLLGLGATTGAVVAAPAAHALPGAMSGVSGLRGCTDTLGLRYGPDSYGRQQWGILHNGRKPDAATPRGG